MGREIGFDVYAKGKNDDGSEYIQRLDLVNADNWVCGRSDITDGWGRYFDGSYITDKWVTPVFVKDFDGWICEGSSSKRFSTHGNGPTSLKYVSFEEFTEAAKEEALECLKMRDSRRSDKTIGLNALKELYGDIMKTYLESSDDECKAKCEKQLDKLRKDIKDFEIEPDEENDYFENQSEAVIKLIDDMECYMSLGLIVIPFFSE